MKLAECEHTLDFFGREEEEEDRRGDEWSLDTGIGPVHWWTDSDSSDRESDETMRSPLRQPNVLAIERAIKDSEWMFELAPDWDDEGAKPVDRATWEMAIAFLRRQAESYWRQHMLCIPVPRITPVSDGSLDLYWKSDRFELLVNISRSNEHFVAAFYGDDYGRSSVKGELDPNSESASLPLISCLAGP